MLVQLMEKAPQFVTNERGEKVAVMLEIGEYEKILDELEELDAIREFDAAKASGESPIPFSEALSEVRRTRK
jgi:hypothetical protein